MSNIYETPEADAIVHSSGWVKLPSGVEITALPLVVRGEERLFAHLDYRSALAVAAREGASLIGYDTVAELHEHGVELTPVILTPDALMASLPRCREHDERVFDQTAKRGWDGKGPVANAGKHWIAGAPKGRSYLRGWWSGGRFIQAGATTGSGPHDDQHKDYATTTVLQRGGAQSGLVEAVRTPMTAKTLYDALKRAWPSARHESLLVLVAQSAIETGNWAACWNWNIGNIKRLKGRDWMMLNNVPEFINGARVVFNPPHPQTHFAAYDSLDDGVTAYLAKLRSRFAIAWPFVESGDGGGFAHALKVAHYYTAPENEYASALVSRMGWVAKQVATGAPAPTPKLTMPHGYRCAVHELVSDARKCGTWHPVGDGQEPQPGDLLISARAGGDPTKGGTGHVEVVTLIIEPSPGIPAVWTLGGNESNGWVHAAFDLKSKDYCGFIRRGPLGVSAMAIALGEFAADVKETAGPKHNPRIQEYHAGARRGGGANAGMPGYETEGDDVMGKRAADEQSWCASGASWCLYRAATERGFALAA